MNSPLRRFIQVLFQVAWADDVISPDEVQALHRTLRQLGLTPPEIICLMDRNLTEKPLDPPEPLDQIFEDREVQMEALQSVMNLCLADGVLQPEELGYLEGLVLRMGLTAQELDAMRVKAGG